MTAATQTALQPPVGKTSWAPTAKVSAGALAAAGTTLLLGTMKNAGGLDFSAEAGAAITTLLTFLIQYWVPERR